MIFGLGHFRRKNTAKMYENMQLRKMSLPSDINHLHLPIAIYIYEVKLSSK